MTDLGIPGLRAAVEIGRGASSIVYRAEQPKLGRTVAVKVLTAGPADDATRRRFSRECRALGALSGHANIVTLYDGDWPEGGAPYLLMTHLSRGSLEDRLRRDGPLPWWEAAEIGVKLAGALEAAHRMGVLHCDVKPSNVLISDFGEPQLADFGIAQIAEPHAAPARSAQASGTPLYAPPEAFDGTAPAPARDVYSLAATIHALIAGRPPVRIERAADLDELVAQLRQTPPADLRPLGVPEQLARALERALAKAPEHRPQTATLFAESLRHALAAEQRSTAAWSPPAPAGPPSGSTPAWRGDDESPTVVVATPRGGPPAAPAWADAGDAPPPSAPGAAPAWADMGDAAAPAAPARAASAPARRRAPARRTLLAGALAALILAAGGAAGAARMNPNDRRPPAPDAEAPTTPDAKAPAAGSAAAASPNARPTTTVRPTTTLRPPDSSGVPAQPGPGGPAGGSGGASGGGSALPGPGGITPVTSTTAVPTPTTTTTTEAAVTTTTEAPAPTTSTTAPPPTTTTTSPPPTTTTTAKPAAASKWVLDRYVNARTGAASPAPEGVTLTLDLEPTRLSGTAACNAYSADYTLEGTKLTLGLVNVTLIGCEDSLAKAESAFLTALQSSTRLDQTKNQLKLSGGAITMLFKPAG